ncbi:MAG TPA: phosphatase PAP2 family protein [Dehalococcoidia bacterium]|nr:phosphatase PAP2 family protein [Dehalococcoidia bacterium]
MLQDTINEWAGHFGILDFLMKLAATDLIYLVVPLGLALWFLPGVSDDRALRQRVWLAATTSVIAGLILASLVAGLHSEARPFIARADTRLLISHSADNGFPSDHATVVFAVAGTLIWWRRTVGLAVMLAGALVSFARVFVGVHWPLDVMAGAAIGIGTGALAAQTAPWWTPLQARVASFFPGWMVSSP